MERTTTVINLFGGPGCGKSTTAALLFARMKLMGMSVELVREYVKSRAWEDRPIKEWDQIYFLGKQCAYESLLYGKVNYIVTDSPILLAGIYQDVQSNGEKSYTLKAAKDFVAHAKERGIVFHNFLLTRTKAYDPNGRWGSEDDAIEMDRLICRYLKESKEMEPITIEGPNETRDYEILGKLNLVDPA